MEDASVMADQQEAGRSGTERTVILGAGQAGGETATWLRQLGYKGGITLVGEEPHPPYRRPALSKGYLSGAQPMAGLLLRPAAAYDGLGIVLRTGTRAIAIDRAGHTVTLSDGETLRYDRLVLALGGRARRLALPGTEASNLLYLRGLDDADAIRRHLLPGKRMVVVGGGYIGLEVAATAVKAGLDVTVLEAAPRLLARVAEPDLSAFFETLHRDAGVSVRTSAIVDGVDLAGDRITAVRCGDACIPADVVVVGIGLVPNTELAEAAGLAVDNGILVDGNARSDDPDVFAVGDCANHLNPWLGGRARIESVPSASELARAAAGIIAGSPKPVSSVPWFWSEQFDVKLQMVGFPGAYDSVVRRGPPGGRSFSLFYRLGDRLQAVACVNRPQDFPVARELVMRRAATADAALADPAAALKDVSTV